MDLKEKEQIFFTKVKEVCKKPGIAYDFECPLCGKFAMGFQTPSAEAYIASCNNCHMVGRGNDKDAS